MQTASIRLAELGDVQKLIEHTQRHHSESGRDGDLIFIPMENSESPTFDQVIDTKSKVWNLRPTETGWERTWVIEDQDKITGMLILTNRPAMPSSLHRAHLMMGIERSHRGGGWGTKLMEVAIGWAKEQPSLDWVQLYVFDHNEPAKALYRKFGFEAVGTVEDLFRVHGQRIADTHMVLNIRK